MNINSFFAWLNRRNSAVLIFILCMANFFGMTLEGGEEQYFSFARQYMDHSWMPDSFTLNHPAGGNLAFQMIAGFLLRFISFEQLTIWGRIFNFLLYAIPLSLIFRKLRISNIEMLFLLQVLFFGHQSLYAGEWIFKNFEEKTIAYIFVFWSLYFLLSEKPVSASFFAAMATWFHFLVGGWMFGFVFIYFFIRKQTLRSALYGSALYLAVILPLLIYLYRIYFIQNPAVIEGVNTNQIYTFWRLKHHLGMFRDAEYFFAHAFGGVVLTLILFGLCLFVFRKYKHQAISKLNTLSLIIFTQQCIFMILAVFDRNGILGKLYPFRTNSLSYLIFLMEFTLIARVYLNPHIYKIRVAKSLQKYSPIVRKLIFNNTINFFLLTVTVSVFIMEALDTVKHLHDNSQDLDQPMMGLIEYSKLNTPRNAVFLFVDGDRPYSFIRRAQRERFVVEKFTPTKSITLYEWYKRAIIKKRLRENIGLIDSVRTVYKIDYLVTDSVYNHPSLDLEREFGKHKLYRVK